MSLLQADEEARILGWLGAFLEAFAAFSIGGSAGLAVLRSLNVGRNVSRAASGQGIGEVSSNFSQAYVAGKFAGAIGTSSVRRMSLPQLRRLVESSPLAEITGADIAALEDLKRRTQRSLRARNATTGKRIETTITQANRGWQGRLQSGTAGRTAAAREVERRAALAELNSALTNDVVRTQAEMRRLIQTELAQYMQQGTVANASPEETVYKIPRPTAEFHCMRLHLLPDGSPRRWKLSEVEGNSNIGLPPAQWTFVIGPVHPFCYCMLFREKIEPRPGPNKGLADQRETTLGGSVFPVSSRTSSQAARAGRSALPPAARSGRRMGDTVVRSDQRVRGVRGQGRNFGARGESVVTGPKGEFEVVEDLFASAEESWFQGDDCCIPEPQPLPETWEKALAAVELVYGSDDPTR